MNEKIKQHYKELFKKHGNKSESVQYSDKDTQYKRFEILTQIDTNLDSIIDIGCGLAHLYDYLKNNGFEGRYLGLDYVEDFITECNEIYKNDNNSKFYQFDIIEDEIVPNEYDYVLLSGVFNNKFEDNKNFMEISIKKMFEACKKGVAFNAMSTYVDYQDEGLYYSNPLEIFDFCKKNITKKVVLRHDYLIKENSIPFEYCIYLYK
jgi:SAM-dependent methyltransferase